MATQSRTMTHGICVSLHLNGHSIPNGVVDPAIDLRPELLKCVILEQIQHKH